MLRFSSEYLNRSSIFQAWAHAEILSYQGEDETKGYPSKIGQELPGLCTVNEPNGGARLCTVDEAPPDCPALEW